VAKRANRSPTDARGIPQKPFFKIGEAAKLCALEPYVLRYWETEFRSLKPQKTSSGQRLYKRRDIELILRIRELLYDRRYTIEGARTWLSDAGQEEAAPAPVPPPKLDRKALTALRDGLEDLIALVED